MAMKCIMLTLALSMSNVAAQLPSFRTNGKFLEPKDRNLNLNPCDAGDYSEQVGCRPLDAKTVKDAQFDMNRQTSDLTHQEAKAILKRAVRAFAKPANAKKLEEAKATATKDENPMAQQIAMTTQVMPVVNSIMHEAIAKYGFKDSQTLHVMTAIAQLVGPNDVIMARNLEILKAKFPPQVEYVFEGVLSETNNDPHNSWR